MLHFISKYSYYVKNIRQKQTFTIFFFTGKNVKEVEPDQDPGVTVKVLVITVVGHHPLRCIHRLLHTLQHTHLCKTILDYLHQVQLFLQLNLDTQLCLLI